VLEAQGDSYDLDVCGREASPGEGAFFLERTQAGLLHQVLISQEEVGTGAAGASGPGPETLLPIDSGSLVLLGECFQGQGDLALTYQTLGMSQEVAHRSLKLKMGGRGQGGQEEGKGQSDEEGMEFHEVSLEEEKGLPSLDLEAFDTVNDSAAENQIMVIEDASLSWADARVWF
jgi:hypothetical protein